MAGEGTMGDGRASSMVFLASLAVLTVVGVATGVGLGLQLGPKSKGSPSPGDASEAAAVTSSSPETGSVEGQDGSAVAGATGDAEPPKTSALISAGAAQVLVLPLRPVLADLAGASDAWVRLEASILLPTGLSAVTEAESNDDASGEAVKTLLVAKVGEDVLAYLRTVRAEELMTPTSLEHLREDLTERLRIRLRQDDAEILINGLIIE